MSSRGCGIFYFLLLLSVAMPAFAKPSSYNLSDKNASKQIVFESKAPVEYIEGVAEGIAGMITLDERDPKLGLSAMVSVPVDGMRTGNAKRDEHLRSSEWLNAERNPSIRFDLSPGDQRTVVKKGEGHWFVKAKGSFFLKGKSKFMEVPVTIKKHGEKLHVDGRFSVNLEEFGVYGPAGIKMIGVKVAPDVRVRFRLVGVADVGWDSIPARRGVDKPRSRKKTK